MRVLIDDGMQIEMGTGIGNYTQHIYRYGTTLADVEVELAQYQRKYKHKLLDRLRYMCHLHSIFYHRKLKSYDVVHYTNYAMPMWKRKDTKYIVTIHDLASIRYPHTNGRGYRLFNKHSIVRAVRKADLILTVSQSVKQEIIQLYPTIEHKIEVLYPGLSKEKLVIQKEIQDAQINDMIHHPFFLFVGTLEKRKNIKQIIEAFFIYKTEEENNTKLVLAGRRGHGFEEIQTMIENSVYQSDILLTGYLSNNDINHLYNHAYAFIFPSIYEGFGCPQLECMYWNTPMILSNIPTNKEISKGYARYFELDTTQSLVDAMKTVKANEVPKEYLQTFFWEHLILKYKTICRNVCQGIYDKN